MILLIIKILNVLIYKWLINNNNVKVNYHHNIFKVI